jgi:23S rRNA (adenine2503-C2)-methyltransferase
VTYEYIMLNDFNDTLEDARALVNLVKGTNGFVNLIAYNPIAEFDYEPSTRDHVYKFANYLKSMGVQTTVRKEFGSDIDAACGQLRAKVEKKRGNNS